MREVIRIRELSREYVAIMGPSGSGKSTLMNLLGCLDTPTAGEYWLNGPRATALHNLELPLVYAGVRALHRRERAAAALEQVGLADRMDHRPNELGRPAPAGGYRRGAGESTGHFARGPADRQARQRHHRGDHGPFAELHAAGQTVIVVTHEADIAARPGRVVVLRDGQVESDRATRGAAA